MDILTTGLPSVVLASFVLEIFLLLLLSCMPLEASNRNVKFLPLICHPEGRIAGSTKNSSVILFKIFR